MHLPSTLRAEGEVRGAWPLQLIPVIFTRRVPDCLDGPAPAYVTAPKTQLNDATSVLA